MIKPHWRELARDSAKRHILALSGGKDSSALAIYLKDKVPNLEYVFCDTGVELRETYQFLEKLENYLGISIKRIKDDKGFDFYLKLFGGVLPDMRKRWCTRLLKLKPYEKYIGSDSVISYVGIRADEPSRQGYISGKDTITTVFPFIEDNLTLNNIYNLLEESSLGLPEYYKWRTRSGCYFCFFQQKIEWIGLLENHPDLFHKAASYEKFTNKNDKIFTWLKDESLRDLSKPERIEKIKQTFLSKKPTPTNNQKYIHLKDIFNTDEFSNAACLICDI